MCSSPIQLDDETLVSCRKCNACITTRKNDWVVRTMAEVTEKKNVLAITLTYANESRSDREGAKIFRYNDDIRPFLNNLRRQIKYYTGKTGDLRFLVAGENGSKKGRVHWHIILLSDSDLSEFGKWTTLQGKKAPFAYDTNLLWSLWPHGLVHVQQPDQGGITYVLKYIMKDQYSLANSKGTMRESTSEVFASSYFRMSKSPPIGAKWLYREMLWYRENLALPTNLNFKVDGYSGYWHPKGDLRAWMLRELYEISEDIYESTGRKPPQLSALLGTVVAQEKDWQVLAYGEEFKETIEEDSGYTTSPRSEIRRKCGGILPCERCQGKLTKEGKALFQTWLEDELKIATSDKNTEPRPHPFCQSRGTRKNKWAFNQEA